MSGVPRREGGHQCGREQAKLDRKIKRAANALRKKLEAAEKAKRAEERTAKAAEKQLAKDLAASNKPAQKTQKEQPNGTVTKAKKSALIVSKEHKVANKARPRGKLPVRRAVVVPVEGEVASGVVVAKTATRSIKRPSRYVIIYYIKISNEYIYFFNFIRNKCVYLYSFLKC